MKIVKLKQYTDKRGILVENTREEIVSHSKHFFISKSKPGVIRGNHYHKHKLEWFYLIQGKCEIYIKDIKTNKIEKRIIEDTENIIIQMRPNKVHAFKNIGKNEMILLAFVNEILDKKNPDTYYLKII